MYVKKYIGVRILRWKYKKNVTLYKRETVRVTNSLRIRSTSSCSIQHLKVIYSDKIKKFFFVISN